MFNNMTLITEMWATNALEYVKFLSRYNIETVAIITTSTIMGRKMAVYANGDEYLKFALNDERFIKEEAQISSLLRTVELFYRIITDYEMEEYYDYLDDDEYEDEYEDKYEDDGE